MLEMQWSSVSWSKGEEWAKRARGDINWAPATGDCELALAVLAVSGPPQLTILGHLEEEDMLRLACTCTSLRQASLAWFPEVTVGVVPGYTDAASLAAWLQRHQARVHLLLEPTNVFTTRPCVSQAEWNHSFKALSSSLVLSLAVHSPFGLPAATSNLTALTRLALGPDVKLLRLPWEQGTEEGEEEVDHLPSRLSVHHLGPLQQLRQLSLCKRDIGGIAEELLSLPALAGLQALRLEQLDRGWQHLQPLNTLLQSLHLPYCGLTAIPEHVSVLTALTRLDLPNNSLERGWEHLQPLKPLLQRLNLAYCGLTAVPEHVSVLTALTRLNLYGTEALAGGWQHLQPLTRLQKLHQNTALPAWQVPPALANLPHVQILNHEVEEFSTMHGSFVDCHAF
ncbi:hypothetical protein D9Q98_008605 [Chlorella vulgaris]|uniref:Uncharacterized protein n=1 Tax=Chlorella vulgaris TaxID=3077 RepID=A0A9D4TI88_CHLVU|nr:hypothetical protein D9Q98_008605 [Chlorella vulgaris]